ncbi:NAD-dependent epimerase/dehydratase family protein [Actinoplanes sp. NPDC049265]|uniref:NAD-dependent epimerase/dehydratase family protein n=1 Tax=Actinoplanes sp. NPDC049265 TaxID=3363902 RepID=UPI00371A895C
MRAFVVGGSGLIGGRIVGVLSERGHRTTTLSRTPSKSGHALDLADASVDDLRPLLREHDAVVFAARTDEQLPLKRPLHPRLRRTMVDPVVRLFAAAREEGVSRGLILGSYYTYFDRLHPEWKLAERHTYVRCRAEQAVEARAAAGFPVSVLELPFILGPTTNWAGPLDRWARSRAPLYAPVGGTAVASATSVALTAADALEAASAEDIPIADENLSWHEMFARIAAAVGRSRRVGRLPASLARGGSRLGGALQALGGKETGINTGQLADLMLRDLYIEPVTGRPLDAAFAETFAPAA